MLVNLPAAHGGRLQDVGLLRATDPAVLADAPFTYPEVGATGDDLLPAGYHLAEHTTVVGSGPAALDRAAAAVFGWRAQRAVGLRINATGPASTPGTVVVLTAGLPRFGYDIPCRVVWAGTEGPLRGFSYGTLPGHPESGEERFTVRLTDDGDVLYTIRVFFRLASPAARLAGPLSMVLQRAATARYGSAIRRATAG